jgi:type II restriction/modification system DNA methylase subunit YeeA
MPDEDNAIPILDGDWFSDDITERFKKFLRVTFGDDHYDENLAFIEEAIGRDVRSYFLKEFYSYHLKMYQKRPIYWLFSSPKGSFNVLIYMHRYNKDTISVILNHYLREFRAKLEAQKSYLEQISISASASPKEKTSALKDIEKLSQALEELRVYERDVLYPLAAQRIEIDLDDGVKVNYAKFGNALAKIPGLS